MTQKAKRYIKTALVIYAIGMITLFNLHQAESEVPHLTWYDYQLSVEDCRPLFLEDEELFEFEKSASESLKRLTAEQTAVVDTLVYGVKEIKGLYYIFGEFRAGFDTRIFAELECGRTVFEELKDREDIAVYLRVNNLSDFEETLMLCSDSPFGGVTDLGTEDVFIVRGECSGIAGYPHS